MIFDSRRQSPFGINIISETSEQWNLVVVNLNAQSKEHTSMKSGNCVQRYLTYVFLAIVVVKIFKKGCNFLTNVNFSYDTKHHTANCAGAHNLNHFECVVRTFVHGTRSSSRAQPFLLYEGFFFLLKFSTCGEWSRTTLSTKIEGDVSCRLIALVG